MVQVLRPIRGSSSEWGPASAWPHQCVTKFLNLCHVVNLITPTPPGSNSRVLLKARFQLTGTLLKSPPS